MLERFQRVTFKSEKRRFKKKKEKDEKVKIVHFYWSENLNLWNINYQNIFRKYFFDQQLLLKVLGQKRAKNGKKRVS